jgi:hypothetical protein
MTQLSGMACGRLRRRRSQRGRPIEANAAAMTTGRQALAMIKSFGEAAATFDASSLNTNQEPHGLVAPARAAAQRGASSNGNSREITSAAGSMTLRAIATTPKM